MMNEYKVELIHEPCGAYMNFVMFSETKEDEVAGINPGALF